MAEPSRAELIERLITATSRAQEAEQTLRDLGRAAGDQSLQHQVVIWRAEAAKQSARADAAEVRCTLAETALRRLLAGGAADDAVARWRDHLERTRKGTPV